MKTIAITFGLALILGTTQIANSDDLPPSYTPTKRQVMVRAAIEFHAPYELLKNIATCESGISMSAIGAEKEVGAYQFKKTTFDGMAKAMGEKLDIHSLQDQSRLFSWVAVNRPQWLNQWSTWRVWYGKGLKKCRV